MGKIKSYDLAVVIPSLDGGGAERVLIDVSRMLANKQISVLIVAVNAGGVFRRLLPSSVSVISLGAEKFKCRWIGLLISVFRLRKILKSQAPKSLLSTLPGGNIITFLAWLMSGKKSKFFAREASTPSVISRKYNFWKRQFTRAALRRVYLSATGVIAPSIGSANDLSLYYSITPDRISVLLNPIEEPNFDQLKIHGHPFFHAEDKVVIGVGRLDRQKRFSDLINAVAVLHKQGFLIKLLIFGDGPEKAALIDQAKMLNIGGYVDLPGFEEEIHRAISSSSVFVSCSELEGLPNSLLQALACRVPVVATDCQSGPREILCDGQFGYLVPVGDINRIAGAVKDALSGSKTIDFEKALTPFRASSVIDKYICFLRLRA